MTLSLVAIAALILGCAWLIFRLYVQPYRAMRNASELLSRSERREQ